jgi:hypothetical protein
MGKYEDRLWREIVRRHGADLAQMTRPAARHARRARPRLLAGTSLALAGAGATLALVVTAASSPPAFAVSRNADGTVTVTLQKIEAIHGANARLAALGIRARLVVVAPGCTVKALPPTAVQAMALARALAERAAPRAAITRLDPRKIPPGKWQVIPTFRVADSVHVERGHLMDGAAPACFSSIPAPPCVPQQARANGRLAPTTPSEADAAQALARVVARQRAIVDKSANSGNSRNSGTSSNSGNSGNSGTSTSAAKPTQAPIAVHTIVVPWVVGCYVGQQLTPGLPAALGRLPAARGCSSAPRSPGTC